MLCEQRLDRNSCGSVWPPHCTPAQIEARRQAALAEYRPRRKRCVDCGVHWADPPSQICPGCEAYQEHRA
jgi:hypothetical protein